MVMDMAPTNRALIRKVDILSDVPDLYMTHYIIPTTPLLPGLRTPSICFEYGSARDEEEPTLLSEARLLGRFDEKLLSPSKETAVEPPEDGSADDWHDW